MRQKLRRMAYVGAGHFFLAVGIIGVFLPILPTTPFVLLAAFCYERGSPRFHALLLENRHVGPYIRNWKDHRSIPLRAKVLAVTMITTSVGWIIYAAPLMIVKVSMTVIGMCVSAYILTRPSTRKGDEPDQ